MISRSSGLVTLGLGLALVCALAPAARAQSVFDVCKGESRRVVAGTGKPSLAIVYPEEFPITPTPQQRNAVGARLAVTEGAKIVPAKDVSAAVALVGAKRWTDKAESCGLPPPFVAVLGQRHPNLFSGRASVTCDARGACELHVDIERHGRPTAERWVRYSAPLAGPKDQVQTIQAAAPKLVAKGVPPDAPTAGLAVTQLPTGKVTVRSDVDGALEADRVMEASAAFAACGPKGRKPHDIRGYDAEWMLSAKGTVYQAFVKPFAGRDPADEAAAECLRKALEATQLPCPRDAKAVKVKTAICL